ncbi:MAG: cation diffusion facilitator family transporter [Dehalococcoidia bacterium]|nr:cation diffusion facilitator family transporter [Dehalococcoidia bacterium]
MFKAKVSSARKPYDRTAAKRAVRISLGISAVFFLIEAIGGWLTNSLALLADAGHVLTDVGALGMTLLAFWFAARPVSPARTYGYFRAEVLAALANGLSVWLVAAFILLQAYRRLMDPPEVLSGPMVVIAFLGLLANLAAALVLYGSSKESLNVRAAFVNVATDAVQSVGVIIAGFLMLFFGWYITDPVVSVIIAVLITYSGGRIVLQATHVLLEGTPAGIDVVGLQDALRQAPGVRAVHDLHTWSITSGYNAMSAHVTLKDEVSHEEEQGVLSHLREVATTQYGIGHVTIQLESGSMAGEEDHEPATGRAKDSR